MSSIVSSRSFPTSRWRTASLLSWVAQAIADRLYKARKRPYRVNFANALSKIKDNLVRLFLFDSAAQLLTPSVPAMGGSVEAVRNERRTLMTLDLDFANIQAYPPASAGWRR